MAANVDSIRRQDPDLTYDDSFRLLTAGNSAEAEDMILEFYIHLLLNGKDVQILTPVGKTRICSTANRKAQALVNPSCAERLEVKIGERVFRAGDRVVQLKNNDYGRNGDIATIISIQCGSTVTVTIRFDDNERTVTYSASQIKRDNLIDHAYAMTIHKAQGSEFDYVILPLIPEQAYAWYKNMIYTAVSRAKKGVILVGRCSALEQAILRSMPSRNTDLLEKIQTALSRQDVA